MAPSAAPWLGGGRAQTGGQRSGGGAGAGKALVMEPAQRSLLGRYARLLADAPHNLLSPADRERVWERHIAEAAHVAGRLGSLGQERWIDVGTGGGLPGLVVAVMRPRAEVVLLDATRKKTDAVARFIEALDVPNASTVTGRAEELARQASHRGAFDGALARAVGSITVSVELTRGFVRDGGAIVVVRGEDGPRCVDIVGRFAGSLGVRDVHAEAVPHAARTTWLVRMRAEGSVPRWLPRANGIPRSRPLEG